MAAGTGIHLSDTLSERDGKKLKPGIYDGAIAAIHHFITLMKVADAQNIAWVIKFAPSERSLESGITFTIYFFEPKFCGLGESQFKDYLRFDVLFAEPENAKEIVLRAFRAHVLPAIKKQIELLKLKLLLMQKDIDAMDKILPPE